MKPETLPLQVSRRFAELHQSTDPKYGVTVLSLRKVADRALETWQKAEFPGADPTPWIESRLTEFLKSLESESESPDEDLYPPAHPRRKRADFDPWAELLGAEERVRALQKSLVETVTRTELRKSGSGELAQMHQRLSHLYELNFLGNDRTESPTGVARAKVVGAAALVHEELERRGVELQGTDRPLYIEAMKVRSEPEVEVFEGELRQKTDGVEIVLKDVCLHVPAREGAVDVQVAKERFQPAGSGFHTPFLEPHEVPYLSRARFVGDGGELIGKVEYTRGAKTDTFTELFVTGAMRGVLVIGKSTLMLRKSLVPYVLTEAAVKSGYMPPEGESALPGTLEWDVPPELRYWRAANGQEPREVRDQLVATGMFAEENVAWVDGMVRRTFTKTFVAEPYPPAPNVFAELMPEQRPEVALYKSYTGQADAFVRAVLGDSAPDEVALLYVEKALDDTQLVALSKMFGPSSAKKFLLGAPDTHETREVFAKLGRPFCLREREGVVFVASHPVARDVDFIDTTLPITNEAADRNLEKSVVTLVKSTVQEDEHFVLGVVLEPETIDAQSDIYSADEIRKSAYRFMAFFQNAGLMHKQLVNDSVRIVESYVAPQDLEIGGQPVKKGTWVMGMIVENDELWAAVKNGDLTGFSIGGSAIRTEEDTAA